MGRGHDHIEQNRIRPSARWGALVLATCGASWAMAQGTAADIDLQERLRQQERERALREQLERSPDVRLPRQGEAAEVPPDAGPDTPCFDIRHITLVGEEAQRFGFA